MWGTICVKTMFCLHLGYCNEIICFSSPAFLTHYYGSMIFDLIISTWYERVVGWSAGMVDLSATVANSSGGRVLLSWEIV